MRNPEVSMQRFFRSSFGVSLGLVFGRLIPPSIGYRLTTFGARRLARRKDSPMVQAVRANQLVIRGEDTPSVEIDRAVDDVLIHAGRCFIDLFHNLQNPAGLKQLSPVNPKLERLIAWSIDDLHGAFIVAPI